MSRWLAGRGSCHGRVLGAALKLMTDAAVMIIVFFAALGRPLCRKQVYSDNAVMFLQGSPRWRIASLPKSWQEGGSH